MWDEATREFVYYKRVLVWSYFYESLYQTQVFFSHLQSNVQRCSSHGAPAPSSGEDANWTRLFVLADAKGPFSLPEIPGLLIR